MTFSVFNPIRSLRAAYVLFVVTPLLVFAAVVLLSWLTLRIAPLFPPLGLASSYCQVLVGQALMLLGAGLPTWHWFRQLRQNRRKRSGITITAIAFAHYLLMLWWCWVGYDALAGFFIGAS